MSWENVQVVRRLFEAVTRGDADAVLELYDREVEWDYRRGRFGDLMGRRIYRGHDGLRAFFRDAYEPWDNFEVSVEELIDAGDRVVSVTTNRGRGKASGVAVENTQHAVWTMRDGRVVRVVWFSSREEALEAVGLSE